MGAIIALAALLMSCSSGGSAAVRAEVPVEVVLLGEPPADLEGRISAEVEATWLQSGIDVRLMFTQASFAATPSLLDELLTFDEAADPCGTDTRIRGLHKTQPSGKLRVYVGGTIATTRVEQLAAGGTCGPFVECQATVRPEHFALVDVAAAERSPAVVAHEIGHLFGLAEADDMSTCGGLLAILDIEEGVGLAAHVRNRNLMRPSLNGDGTLEVTDTLTEGQVDRAVSVLCASPNVGARLAPDECSG